MRQSISPVDTLVEIDLPGYLEMMEDPSGEEERFDLDGKEAR